MKTLIVIPLMSVLIATFWGCGASFQNRYLSQPDSSEEIIVPNVEVTYDKWSVSDAYLKEEYFEMRYQSKPGEEPTYQKRNVRVSSDEELENWAHETIFSEFRKSFPKPDQINGYGEVRLKERKHLINFLWYLPSIATISLINLTGFPALSHTAKFTIEIEFFDSQQNSISVYETTGKATIYVAYYWGYPLWEATKRTSKAEVAVAANYFGLLNAIENL